MAASDAASYPGAQRGLSPFTQAGQQQAKTGENYNDYMRQSGRLAGTVVGGMTGGALNTLPWMGRALATGAATGAGDLASGGTPKEAAVTAATGAVAQPVAEGLGFLARKASSAISGGFPSATRAGQAFQQVSAAVGSHTVPMTDELSDSLMGYRKLVDAGGSRSMSVEKLLQRVTNPDKGPLTYDEARLFQSNISRLSADEAQRLTPVMKRAVGNIAGNLGDAVSSTAESGGKLEQFQGAMKEYGRAMRLKDAGEFAKDKAFKAILGGGATAAGYELVKKAVGK
jgi:hypothetical protein